MPRAATRNNDLALIHIAKAQLGIPDDQYRDMLFTIGRVRSSKDLDPAGRQRLIDHFKKCGWSMRPKAGGKAPSEWAFVFRLTQSCQPLGKKLFRLAQRIGALQSPPLPVMPRAWAEAILAQMRGQRAAGGAPVAAPLEMASFDELHDLVAALEIHRRRLAKAAADAAAR